VFSNFYLEASCYGFKVEEFLVAGTQFCRQLQGL